MKKSALVFGVWMVLIAAMQAQTYSSSASLMFPDPMAEGGGGQAVPSVVGGHSGALSKVGLGVGVSTLGIGLDLTTNLSQRFNVRATGNLLNYSTNFTTEGITADAKLGFASAGASLDVYPFRGGFRLSPGVLFINQNKVTATTGVSGGTSFTLNNQTYYSAYANTATGATPIVGNGTLGLNATKPALTITTGWGNTVERRGHWSFPLELGVALIGTPAIKMNLAGWACYDQAQTICTNIADPTNPIAIAVQSNLTAQVAKWNSDIEPLKTYPIASFGINYSFRIR